MASPSMWQEERREADPDIFMAMSYGSGTGRQARCRPADENFPSERRWDFLHGRFSNIIVEKAGGRPVRKRTGAALYPGGGKRR